MKKLLEISPFIAVGLIIVILVGLFALGVFDKPQETLITTSALTEVIQTAKLSTAQYVQHGIAKAHIEDKGDGYVLYYAIVKPNVNLEDITYEIDHNAKEVLVTLPKEFTFDVTLLQDDAHPLRLHPKDPKNWTGKDVMYICKTDAKEKAEANTELVNMATENLKKTIDKLLEPILSRNEYTLKWG